MFEGKSDLTRRRFLGRTALFGAALTGLPAIMEACGGSSASSSGAPRKLTLGYVEPHDGTVLGYHGDLFKANLEKVSNGSLTLNIYPGGVLGDDVVLTKKVVAGEVDFAIATLANSSVVAPAASIAQLEYVFTGEAHLLRALNDASVNQAFKQLISQSVSTARTLGLYTEGIRNAYAKFPIHSIADVKGKKIRIQASATENAFWSAYGAVPLQISFTQVYTSLQTGVIDMAENNVTAYLAEKHYEPAPYYNSTEHEADAYHVWMSMKAFNSLSKQQQGWVDEAATMTQPDVNNKAIQLWHQSLDQVLKLGVHYVNNVDKSGFMSAANAIQDQQAQKLGQSAVSLLAQIRKLG